MAFQTGTLLTAQRPSDDLELSSHSDIWPRSRSGLRHWGRSQGLLGSSVYPQAYNDFIFLKEKLKYLRFIDQPIVI